MISIPFVGSKKYSYKKVKSLAEQGDYKIVYEPFGGSCVLSVNLFNDGLVNKAVVNDYDRFFDNYEKYLDYKDVVVEKGYGAGLKRIYHGPIHGAYIHDENGNIVSVDRRCLNSEEKKILQDIISENVPEEYWRYLTLGNNFAYSAVGSHSEIKLSDFTMFASYLDTDKQRYYLKTLQETTIENLDYREFLEKYESEFNSDSLIIVDPPYPNTVQEQYKGLFSEIDAVELIEYLNKLPCDYIYFHSNKDEIDRWFSDTDCQIYTIIPHNSARRDYLIYVKNRGTQLGCLF